MPRTLGRGGQTLATHALGDTATWSVRLVDMAGDPLTVSGWTYYQVPEASVVACSRRATLDGGPATMTLTLLGPVVPQAYWRVEVDRVVGGAEWPYFTGIIDQVSTGQALNGGAIVTTYELACLDELQRCKGYHINSIGISPAYGTEPIYKASGVCSEIRGSLTVDASLTQDLPGAATTYDLLNKCVFDNNSDFSSPYVYTTHYTLDTTVWPAKVTWTGAGPAAGVTVYYRYPRVDYFGLRTYRDTVPAFFRLPYGRDKWDLYHTEVVTYSAGAKTITPADPNPYSSTNALLDPDDGTPYQTTGQNEYLAIVQASTGEQKVKEIASTSAAGVITLTATVTFTDGNVPVAGDAIRVVSAEMYAAWEEYGQRHGATTDRDQIRYWYQGSYQPTLNGAHNDTTTTIAVTSGAAFAIGDTILIDAEQMYVSNVAGNNLTVVRAVNTTVGASHSSGVPVYIEWQRRIFESRPNVGVAIAKNYHFLSTDSVFINCSPCLSGESGASADQNRLEEIIRKLLVTGTGVGLYATGNILTGLTAGYLDRKTGAYMKNFVRYQTELDKILGEFKSDALPPNAYIRGERDGKLSVLAYYQRTVPDLTVRGVTALTAAPEPAPVTSVVVIAADPDLVNMAPTWFSYSTGAPTNANRVVDGLTSSTSAQGVAWNQSSYRFVVPGANPIQAFPVIDKISIYGTGFVSVFITQGATDFYPPGHAFVALKGATTPYDVGREELAVAAAQIDESSDWTLIVELYADNSTAKPGTAGEISEIQIMARKYSAWRAELSDDTTGMPTGWQPTDTTQFGSIWAMSTAGSSVGAGSIGTQVSRLYAPSSYLRRVAAKYSSSSAAIRHRTEIITLPGVSQANTRTIAEDYTSEYTRRSRRYHLRCLLDDRIEIGDTVRVLTPDAARVLMVEGYADSGGAEMDLDLVDYS